MQFQGPLIFLVAAVHLTFIVVAIIASSYFWRLAHYLEFFHRDAWLKLGRPRFMTSEPYAALISPFQLTGFIVFRRYRWLGDKKLNQLGDRNFAYMLGTWSMLLVLLLLPHHRFSGVTGGGATWSIVI